MILLIGGTSETAPLATGIAEAGCAVLVSTATDVPLDVGDHPLIRRRTGRLDERQMVELIKKEGVTAIVDAAHPYAVAAHKTVELAARRLKIPCFVFRRPVAIEEAVGKPFLGINDDAKEPAWSATAVLFVENHAEAAELAFAGRSPVLLTTGSRNLAPYAEAARRTGTSLVVRVLNTPESLAACREAGISKESILTGRGPFSVEENIAAIRRFGIGTLVTKEGGKAGGMEAKYKAARLTKCRLIVIRRPSIATSGPVFDNETAMIAAVKKHIFSLKQRKRPA